jgi:hypothetical protein
VGAVAVSHRERASIVDVAQVETRDVAGAAVRIRRLRARERETLVERPGERNAPSASVQTFSNNWA